MHITKLDIQKVGSKLSVSTLTWVIIDNYNSYILIFTSDSFKEISAQYLKQPNKQSVGMICNIKNKKENTYHSIKVTV